MTEPRNALRDVKATLSWAMKSQSAPRINAMIDLARSEPGIPILPEQLDRDPMLLNVVNGTLELATGRLREHRQADYLTKLCPVAYDPAATCPVWESFLQVIFARSQSLITYMQRLLGHCLTGLTTEQIAAILYGIGANGKSTLVNTFLSVLGADYAGKASRDLLMTAKHDKHPTTMAWLHGMRFVVAAETAEGARLDEALVKDLTGGDPVTARRMREDPWTFNPTHKLAIVTNHKPEVRGTDHAIWRRLRLIPFNVVIPAQQQDKQLPAKLQSELPGILAWCVRGCLDWQRNGLQDPQEVLTATAEYRTAQDVLAAFLADRCLKGPDYREKASNLYDAYKGWSEAGGEKTITQRRFGDAMTEKGFTRDHSNGTWYVGVAVRVD